MPAPIGLAGHIYFGDVHVGTITRRVGQSLDQEAWQCCAASPAVFPHQVSRPDLFPA
jgi:hypothetical protein